MRFYTFLVFTLAAARADHQEEILRDNSLIDISDSRTSENNKTSLKMQDEMYPEEGGAPEGESPGGEIGRGGGQQGDEWGQGRRGGGGGGRGGGGGGRGGWGGGGGVSRGGQYGRGGGNQGGEYERGGNRGGEYGQGGGNRGGEYGRGENKGSEYGRGGGNRGGEYGRGGGNRESEYGRGGGNRGGEYGRGGGNQGGEYGRGGGNRGGEYGRGGGNRGGELGGPTGQRPGGELEQGRESQGGVGTERGEHGQQGQEGGNQGKFTREEQAGLAKHNAFRRVHGVPPMRLNRELCDAAKEWAQKIARKRSLEHSKKSESPGQGENLSYGCASDKPETVQQAVSGWYNEICKPGYRFRRGRHNPKETGHFSQVVWKESTLLGIGRAESVEDGMKCSYTVARYKKAGNMDVEGEYKANVPKGSFTRHSYCSSIKYSSNDYGPFDV